MCHIILALPLLALPIFWLMPLSFSVPIYIAVLALSIWMYWSMIRIMKYPVMTGQEQLLQSTGEIIDSRDDSVRVRVQSEIWQAKSNEHLKPGDKVIVVDMVGMLLTVRRFKNGD